MRSAGNLGTPDASQPFELENVMKTLVKAVAVLALSAASLSAFALTNADRYGEAATPAAAERTIVIGPNTRWVNVNHGEIVKFVANGQQVAPQGAIDHNVRVYIATTLEDGGLGD